MKTYSKDYRTGVGGIPFVEQNEAYDCFAQWLAINGLVSPMNLKMCRQYMSEDQIAVVEQQQEDQRLACVSRDQPGDADRAYE